MESKTDVVTPRGGLLMPFLWEVDKRLRRTFAEAKHPVAGLMACATELHTVRVANFAGKRVLVACDMVNAAQADRALLLQLAHALVAAGAKVELHLTVPRADPAYATPPQARARMLVTFLAPTDATLVAGEGRLDLAMSRCDFLLWAHNVPDAHLPRDLKPAESFASWAQGLGIDLFARRGASTFSPAALARLREHLPTSMPKDYVIVGQEEPYADAETERRAQHVAHVAALTAAQWPDQRIVALRDLSESPPLAALRGEGSPLRLASFPAGLSAEQVCAIILQAQVGFSLPGNLLHLGSLLGTVWYTSYDARRPFAGWDTAHYPKGRLLSPR